MENNNADNPQEDKVQHHKNWLEWTVFAFSSILVLAVLAYYTYHAIASTRSGPQLSISVTPSNEKQELIVTVHNSGGSAAEDVKVEVTMLKGGKDTGKAEISFKYVPQRSSREGKVGFGTGISQADSIAARVVSFIEM